MGKGLNSFVNSMDIVWLSTKIKTINANKTFKKVFVSLLFLVSLHLVYSYVGIYKFIGRRPCSIHSWAQAQRASVALNYYKTDMNFFKPRIHKYDKGEGITGLEFPLVNYIPAVLYKMFGFNEKYYRGFVLFTLFIGLFFFNLLIFSFVKNYFLSIALLASAYASPVLMYYSTNFMPDVTSLGFVLAAWYFFFQFAEKSKTKYYYICLVLLTLAALVKVVSLIPLVVILCLFFLDHFKFFKKENKLRLFENKGKLIFFAGISFLVVVAWYMYARWLTNHYKAGAFALDLVPMATGDTYTSILLHIKSLWLYDYFAYESYVLFGVVIIVLVLSLKLANRLLATITILTFLGSVCFVVFFFNQFKDHDYYIIPILPFMFLFLLSFGDLVNKLSVKYFRPIKLILIIVLVFNLKECFKRCKYVYMLRYDSSITYFTGNYYAYEDLEPKLRKLGIKRTDKTLSGFDFSFCTSLYLMDQQGYTFSANVDKGELNYHFSTGKYKYLILSDSAGFNKLYPNDFANKVIGSHRGLIIYKLN